MDNLEQNQTVESNVDEKDSITNLYELYRSNPKNGSLSREAYENAVIAAAEPTTKIKEGYLHNMLGKLEISNLKLTPETLKIYAILRGEAKLGNTGMGDQPLLAEVLYRQGDYDALIKLVKSHLHIFH